MERGFLPLTALSPCFLWNQQALGGVRDLKVGAGVGDRLERGVLGGRAWNKLRSPVETHQVLWRGDSPGTRRSDSGRARQPSELKPEDMKPSSGEDENVQI